MLRLLARAYHERVRGDELQNLRKALHATKDAWEGTIDPQSDDFVFLASLMSQISRLEPTPPVSSVPALSSSATPTRSASSPSVKEILSSHQRRIQAIDKNLHPVMWIAAQMAYGKSLTFFGSAKLSSVESPSPKVLDGFLEGPIEAFAAFDAALGLAVAIGLPRRELDSIHRECVRAATLAGMLCLILDDKTEVACRNFFDAESLPQGKGKQYLERALKSQIWVAQGAPLEANERAHLYEHLKLGDLQVQLRDWQGACASFASAGKAAEQFLADVECCEAESRRILKVLGEWMEIAPFVASLSGRYLDAILFAEQGRARLLSKATGLALLNLDTKRHEQLSKLRSELITCERKLNSKTLLDRMPPLRRTFEVRGEIKKLCVGNSVSDVKQIENLIPLIKDLIDEKTCLVIPLISKFGGRILIARLLTRSMEIETITSASSYDFPSLPNGDLAASGVSTRDLVGVNNNRAGGSCLLEGLTSKIGEWITKPLHEKLLTLPASQRPSHVILLPQGVWGHLPIGLGLIGNNEHPLLQGYTLSMGTGLSMLRQVKAKLKPTSATRRSVVIANPSHKKVGVGLALPFATIEAKLVARHFGPKEIEILPENLATKENVCNQLKQANFWHFACHGAFDKGDARQARLFLAGDDVLTAAEVLESTDFCAPELVVLSACETGLFDQKDLPFEFTGLLSAFLQTGASGVVVSLWKVSDLATCLLMGALYERIFKQGLPVSSALQQAQLWLRDASRSVLEDQIAAWAQGGTLSKEDIASLRGGLQQLDATRPFADPIFWGGLVYYGAHHQQLVTSIIKE